MELPRNSMKPRKLSIPKRKISFPSIKVQKFKKEEQQEKGETMEEQQKEAPKTVLEFSLKKELIGEAADHLHFFVSDGTRLRDLKELASALETMHEGTFKYHANDSKNDFASWTKEVFGEHRLAEQLSNAGSKEEAQVAVLKHIVSKI